MVIRWISKHWNRRRTSVIEKRLADQNERLKAQVVELERELEAERVTNRLHEIEIAKLAMICERDRLRVECERNAYAERTEPEDAQYRAVG